MSSDFNDDIGYIPFTAYYSSKSDPSLRLVRIKLKII